MQTAALWAGVMPSLALAAGWQVSAAVTTYALVGALVASRFGLWTFDLAVSQLLQERVPDAELGAPAVRPFSSSKLDAGSNDKLIASRGWRGRRALSHGRI